MAMKIVPDTCVGVSSRGFKAIKAIRAAIYHDSSIDLELRPPYDKKYCMDSLGFQLLLSISQLFCPTRKTGSWR
jgi:hypothetical protein